MKKDSIVRFVGFTTTIEPDKFIQDWEGLVRKQEIKQSRARLFQNAAPAKNKFCYVSMHEWVDADVQLNSLPEKRSDQVPENHLKITQVGGYIFLESEKKMTRQKNDTRLISFISHSEDDIEFYKKLSLCSHLNIYQAYYENCLYGYVLELFVQQNATEELLLQLKERVHADTGIYTACMEPHYQL